ncbi:MAG: hypothetical protein ACFE9P_14140, partial [Candidatus Hermodarchaeota archaeon]
MGVFPENPCEFAVDFIRKMRNHPDIVQIPSSRQVLSIPRLILSRYYRIGKVTPNDYIEISTVTSFPDNQQLAQEIAFEILFPNYKKDMVESFFPSNDELREEINNEIVTNEIKSELDQIQEIINEIEISKSIDQDSIMELENFFEDLNQKRDQEPYKSALHFFNDDSELYKEEISSLDKLIEEAKNRLEQKINSLEPEDIKAGVQLGLNELIQSNSLREWEKITANALDNKDIALELENLIKNDKFDDLLQTMKYLNESITDQNIKKQIKDIKNQLQNQINNLDQLFNAAKTLGETPQFDPQKILQKSLENSSFEHNYNLANSLDQYFGTNLRAELLNKFQEQVQNSGMNLSLENLTKSAFADKSWNKLFKQTLQNAIGDAKQQKVKFEALKSLTYQLQQLANSCANIHCSQKMDLQIPNLIKETLQICETSEQLRNTIEFFRKIGLNPETDMIKDVGK